MDDTEELLRNYHRVMARLRQAEAEAGRPEGAVSLVVVSKTQPVERLLPLLEAGHRLFGENRVQEAEAKWPALRRRFPDLRLHLIGPLQSNKLREAVALFDLIETLDRDKLARLLAAEPLAGRPCPDLYVQVNSGAEPQKAGILPDAADAFIARLRDQDRLPLRGLMCIPPVDQDPTPYFAQLASLAGRHRLAELSMGMSADYPLAIAQGATHVRVGTAIFGHRPPAG
jgi:pyridoxal phosphate enzyme (YggS family)